MKPCRLLHISVFNVFVGVFKLIFNPTNFKCLSGWTRVFFFFRWPIFWEHEGPINERKKNPEENLLQSIYLSQPRAKLVLSWRA